MNYLSLKFIFLILISIPLYYLIGRKRQLWVLALINLIFYASAGVQYIPFIVISIISTFFAGKKIGEVYEEAENKSCESSEERKIIKETAKKKSKRILLITIFIVIGMLVICKYTNFIFDNIKNILNIKNDLVLNIILPLGISFYSFMALSYILDIYWKKYKPEKSFLLYAVYLSYFPHIIQGPIDRFNDFKEQVKDGIKYNYKNIIYGAQLCLWGMFKKLVIADRMGIFVDSVFRVWDQCGGAILTAAIIGYSIQIYADFSGYMDIATGISEMFGIKISKNFNHPYFSRTMAEFWRRWHISLQEWFKDYIYYPVVTSKYVKNARKYLTNKGKTRCAEIFVSCFPILIVWLISGIWHGAAWKYVAWGLFHAMLLILSEICNPILKRITKSMKLDTEKFGWKFIQILRTFTLCCIGRVFFRATNINTAIKILGKMFTQFNFGQFFAGKTFGLDTANAILLIFAIIVLLIVDMLQEKINIRKTLDKQNIIFRWLIIYAGMFAIIIFGIYGPVYNATDFIYEQF